MRELYERRNDKVYVSARVHHITWYSNSTIRKKGSALMVVVLTLLTS